MPTEIPPPDWSAARRPSALATLVSRWPGRAVIAGSLVKLLAVIALRVVGTNFLLEVIGTAGTLALLVGLLYFVGRLVALARRRLLWRVRRKLILSYIFVGLVPVLLIIVFFLLCGLLLFGTVSQYVIDARLRSAAEQAQFLARATAMEAARLRSDDEATAFLDRKQQLLAERYPEASVAIIPVGRRCDSATPAGDSGSLQPPHPIAAGPWRHLEVPRTVPEWVPCAGYSGLVLYDVRASANPKVPASPAPATYLAIRAVALADGAEPRFAVVLNLPINERSVSRLRQDTGIQLRGLTVGTNGAVPERGRTPSQLIQFAGSGSDERFELPWFVFTDDTDWETGLRGSVTLSIGMSLSEIYERLRPARLAGRSTGNIVVFVLSVVGVLFLIIQFMALVVGLALARSITGSVHELFVGTERVQLGDFSHRIEVQARDQLGELADSFNTMTGRLTQLLAEMAEKKRLEEELRIAREIQMSLLPQGQIRIPGLQMTANCTPAREVGGDYYDFLPLDEHRTGILIADVSGKGTSAALYMAELKGLMLSLSQIHRSPLALMLAANKIIAANLDSRSFITMTYAVLDLEAHTMTYSRAGHTPLIHLPARGGDRRARFLVPSGMVLGLKVDNGEKFAAVLEEATIPLEPGDLFVLFTDGITEAMDANEELFGEERLGALIEEHADLPFEELRERILREVRAFAGEPGPHDDMTLILLRVDDDRTPAIVATTSALAHV